MANTYRTCRRCGRHDSVVGRISNKGNCFNCAVKAMSEANDSLSQRRGPLYTNVIRRQLVDAARQVYVDGITIGDERGPLVRLAGAIVEWSTDSWYNQQRPNPEN